MNIQKLISTDRYEMGVLIALLLPVLSSAVFLVIIRIIMRITGNTNFMDDSGILLLGMIPNILIMRYFILKANLEKTGRAVLFVSLLLIIAFFIFTHRVPLKFPF